MSLSKRFPFCEQCLYYIEDFKFESGAVRNKYLLVLAIERGQIIYSLTSNSFADQIDLHFKKYGCRKQEYKEFFYIPKSHQVGTNNYQFPKETAISFRNNIVEKEMVDLNKYISKNKSEYIAQVTINLYRDIIGCMLSGMQCPNQRIKNILTNRLLKPSE